MKQSFFWLALTVFLTSCSEKSDRPVATPSPSGSNVLSTAVTAHQNMVKTVDVAALNKAIEMFQLQEGRLPKDLPELVAKKYLPSVPEPPAGSRIVYDAVKGAVTIEKQ